MDIDIEQIYSESAKKRKEYLSGEEVEIARSFRNASGKREREGGISRGTFDLDSLRRVSL